MQSENNNNNLTSERKSWAVAWRWVCKRRFMFWPKPPVRT